MREIAGLHIEAFGAGPRVKVVDLPGHGHSTIPMPGTLDAIVAAIATQFANPDQPVTILGWSFGGTIALRWALLQPQRVARLLLVGATPRFIAADDWPHAMAPTTLARFGDELAVAYRLTLQRFLSLQVQGSDEGRATLAALRTQLFARGEPSRATLAAALDVLAETDLRDDARAIAAPTLVVTGDRDALVPSGAGAWLAQAIPGARHVDIPGAAHAPFLSHPRAFAAALDGFLDAR
jgi:pimeloyl-[acyl-carrier protein] methyl ester esterase